ncbi:cell wall protein [Diplodia corticola]|uniref:Cell wall protein n=1 Tax=Diplodia corticola TaxID=236234 RepID=A0A1J9QSX5_9PEZI|nr:cell wall protein [Diplodia corticola]OJD32062.1 cell wall protein [Diplodia corticola]
MKPTPALASALILTASRLVGRAIAVDPRFPPTGPFKMTVLAPDQPAIHYSPVKASGGYFYINKPTNSTCGDVEPILDGPTADGGALSTYGDGREDTQQTFLDISGAAGGIFSYLGPLYKALTFDHIADEFSRVAGDDISQLYYEDAGWLACPTGNDPADGVYVVYADKAYGHAVGREECIPFGIRTDAVEGEGLRVCEYL